jgi:nitroimidazol reductase NimA-like FMN-containing flavoprotein (pyridoxamine 5'-phosphate oxidase superfamily)
MTSGPPPAFLEELDEDTCRELFGGVDVGRIAFRHGGTLEIFPITVTLHEGEPHFLTAPGTKLGTAASDSEVLVETDGYDADEQTGWSVIARGTAHLVIDHDDLEPLMALNFEPWVDLGRRGQWVRIEVEEWTGRRLRRDDDREGQ